MANREERRLETVRMLREAANQLEAKGSAVIIDDTYYKIITEEGEVPYYLKAQGGVAMNWRLRVSVFAVSKR